jgi:hypothetical protein
MSAPSLSATAVLFRFHFDDGTKAEVEAVTPQDAGAVAVLGRAADQTKRVTKIKQVRTDEVGKPEGAPGVVASGRADGLARDEERTPAGAAATAGGEQPRESRQ